MKISVIGTGTVGQTLASKLVQLGHDIMIGTRNVSEKLAVTTKDKYGNPPFSEWYKANSKVSLGTFTEAAAFGEIVVNATHGGNSLSALNLAGAKTLEGKILMDIANPLDFSKGNIPSLLPEFNNTNSLGEQIQKSFPKTKVVKTLNTVWSGLMVNPGMIGGGDHLVFISGNDAGAKEKVKSILKEFGWNEKNIIDLGDITGARATESYLHLWLRLMGAVKSGAFNIRLVS